MKVLITDRVGTVPDYVKDYAKEKALHLEHFFEGTMKVEIIFKAESGKSIAEMIVSPRGGAKLVASAKAKDFKAVVDLLSDKIERQVRKFKGKLRKRKRTASGVLLLPAPKSQVEEPDDEVTYDDIIREMDLK